MSGDNGWRHFIITYWTTLKMQNTNWLLYRYTLLSQTEEITKPFHLCTGILILAQYVTITITLCQDRRTQWLNGKGIRLSWWTLWIPIFLRNFMLFPLGKKIYHPLPKNVVLHSGWHLVPMLPCINHPYRQ